MQTATRIIRALFGLIGIALLVLGALFWTDHALSLIPLHMALGGLFVLCMWALAALALGVPRARGMAAWVLVWSFVVPVLGGLQVGLLPGSLHWIVQSAHLLVGLIAMGLGHALAARICTPREGASSPASA